MLVFVLYLESVISQMRQKEHADCSEIEGRNKQGSAVFFSCSIGKFGLSQVRMHAVIWICRCSQRKEHFLHMIIYLNRHQDKWHCGRKIVVPFLWFCFIFFCAMGRKINLKANHANSIHESLFWDIPPVLTGSLAAEWHVHYPSYGGFYKEAISAWQLLFSSTVKARWAPIM